MGKIPKMKMRWGVNTAMTPTFVGRKKLYKGYRFYDHQNWLGRTSHALKSGVQRKHAAYDAVWRAPPMPAPLRPCFRDIGLNRARVPPAIVFPEDAVANKFRSDPEIQGLFQDRLHPFGNEAQRGGTNSKELPPFVSKAQQLQSALRHGPQMMPKLQRRFVAHYKMLTEEKGLEPKEAYATVKEALLEQYQRFEQSNTSVLEMSANINNIHMRDECVANLRGRGMPYHVLTVLARRYNQFQKQEEHAVSTSYQRRDMVCRASHR